jgi:hypothetical protein
MTATRRHIRTAVVAATVAATLASPAASAGDVVLRRDGSKAVEMLAPPPAPAATPDTADGFQLDDAGLGAVATLALVLASAGVASMRRRASA